MKDPKRRIRCAPSSELAAEISRASGCCEDPLPIQVRYLVEYLSGAELQARGLLIEEDYIDRHYLEEYVAYYASKLHAPSPRCTRVHVFQRPVDDEALARWLARAAAGERERTALQDELSSQYIGFIVVRPHASAPIGRTLLRTYGGAAERCYAPAQTSHDVHLLGLELSIQALPFQQQDRAVGACATTAIWTVLSRVLRNDGARSVTPFEVTQAATRYVTYQRAIPAERGLTEEQINAAIRAFGYEPHHLSSESTKLLKLCLKCYLTSGIPVILDVSNDDVSLHHAIVLCGFRPTDPGEHAADIAYRSNGVELVTRNFVKVYAHDDRLGPYARMSLELRPCKQGAEFRLKFLRRPGELDACDLDEDLVIHTAIVPLYRKLRLTAEDLIAITCELLPNVRDLADGALSSECFFCLGGKYLSEVLSRDIEADRRLRFVTHAHLSRYVGVVRFFVDRVWFLDVLVDTTDIHRPDPPLGAILALLPRQRELLPDLRLICEVMQLPALVA